jgi:hypothetical protein
MSGFSRSLFAIASASLAILSLAYGDFAPGGQSLPAWIPGREAWIHGSALLVLAAGVGLCFSRTASTGALTIGAYLAVWAVLCAPQILPKPLSIGAWYGFCEALTSLIGAWILYVSLRRRSRTSQTLIDGRIAVRTAQVLFGLTCVFYGWSHFAYADYTAGMVPAWLPHRLALAYLTGFAHVAAGLGILAGILAGPFGVLVWVPSFFIEPRPAWATPPQNQWSELVVSLVLAASAWVVAAEATHPSPKVGE